MEIHNSNPQRHCSGGIDLIEVSQLYQHYYEDRSTEIKTKEIKVTENFRTEESATTCYDSNETDARTEYEYINRNYLWSLQMVDRQSVLFNVFDNINYGESTIEENAETCDGSSIIENNLPQDGYIQNYECYTCRYKTDSKPELISHIKKTHRKHNRMHLTKNCYKHHILKNEHVQRCSPCKSFYKQSKDNTHSNRNNSLKCNTKACLLEKPFGCSVCEYRCSSKSVLKCHIRIHTQEKPFKCSICEYRCKQKGCLNRHVRIHTQEKPFKCSVCEHGFNEKSNLERHMRIHTQEKPFKCSICEYRCIQKGALKSHMRIHTREKPFKCSICEYRCNRKSTLKSHMRIHTQEKPFKCSICEYRCIQKGALKSHMQIHTQEKPFKCSICEYRCNRKSALKSHMRIHTREKPLNVEFVNIDANVKVI